MDINISNQKRATLVGFIILLAYSMLTYTITKNVILGFITDIISGIAVILIPFLLFPIFDSIENKKLNYGYFASRIIEGILMIIGGIFILNSSIETYRDYIYQSIHIYFFISGALFFYVLFFRTKVIPRFISVWGVLATFILLVVTIIRLFGVNSIILDSFLLPTIICEWFLAIWLITKGFKMKNNGKK